MTILGAERVAINIFGLGISLGEFLRVSSTEQKCYGGFSIAIM
jgi:hypothetical protein